MIVCMMAFVTVQTSKIHSVPERLHFTSSSNFRAAASSLSPYSHPRYVEAREIVILFNDFRADALSSSRNIRGNLEVAVFC